MNWVLIPKKGIASKEHAISFGDERAAIRVALENTYSFKTPEKYPDEDDFQNGDTYIRVRFDEQDRVRDIEFLSGTLLYKSIPLRQGTNFDEIESEFSSMGLTFRNTEWFGAGKDCVELEINIATREEVGGDGRSIEWVILSNDLD